MSCDTDIIIIGAGVIGLAVASEVTRENREVFILEKNENFGRETSSRNSGTIHTSILSPQGSLNARLCFEGSRLLYELCRKYGVDHRETGKLLVACDNSEAADLETLFQRRNEGIEMRILSRQELLKLEPDVNGQAALLFPTAGVVDPHALMRCYLGIAYGGGAQLVCNSEISGIEKTAEGYRITIKGSEDIHSRIVINCAGHHSDDVAVMAGIDIFKENYKLSYFKGEYYSICTAKARRMGQRLIYPMLKPGGLVGIHTVLDTEGKIRIGPDFYPVEEIDYSIDDSRKGVFLDGIRRLFSFVGTEDIDPESTGIMPRRYAMKEKFREFVICHEEDNGLPGFINVLGIESPGLTSSPAIAKHVSRMVDEILG